MSEIPEVFAIFEQKLAHVLSFTVVPLKIKDLKNALEEILTYFSSIVERASKAESRIAELEAECASLGVRLHDEMSQLEIATDLGNKRWTALNEIYENGEKHSAWWCKRKAQEGLGIK